MAHMLQMETPSRIMRRIEAGGEKSMPSLPSMPIFEDSAELSLDQQPPHQLQTSSSESGNLSDYSPPITSTPIPSTFSGRTANSAPSLSSQRFAASLVRSSASRTYGSSHGHVVSRDSFEVDEIPSLPSIRPPIGDSHFHQEDFDDDDELLPSNSSVPDMYLPPEHDAIDDDYEQSLAEALEPVSRISSPPLKDRSREQTPKKNYDYSVSLRSEPKPSPLDPLRNVVVRRPKPLAGRRTPSLTRSGASSPSSEAHSTPQSMKSIPLPPSATASPSLMSEALPPNRAVTESPVQVPIPQTPGSDEEARFNTSAPSTSAHSMDITDIHISPGAVPPVGQDSSEPTFSSDDNEEPEKYPLSDSVKQLSKDLRSGQSRPSISSVLSSPGYLATPTPAFPRPRARFNVPPPASPSDAVTAQGSSSSDFQPTNDSEEEGTPAQGDRMAQLPDGPLTPHTRRRSFLLSVINSTARPRPRFAKPATPHPRAGHKLMSPGNMTVENTPMPARVANMQTSAATPTHNPATPFHNSGSVPRKGLHPLSQTFSASDSPAASPLPSPGNQQAQTPLPAWAPGSNSGYESDRMSFISTASSHDLTTHARANTSFDPAMGFAGNGGGGVGRFNATKLNNYLHGLNRRLQEENEALTARVIALEEEKDSHSGASQRTSFGSKGRRVSAGASELQDVPESPEGWLEEKAELEELVDELRLDVEQAEEKRMETEKKLVEEKEDRATEKERMKQRMAAVEKGVQQIVADLERKLKETEARCGSIKLEVEGDLRDLRSERDYALARAQKAESALESGKELGGELKEANARVDEVLGDLRSANLQIRQLEDEASRADRRIEDLERAVRVAEDFAKRIEKENEKEKENGSQLAKRLEQVTQDYQSTKDFAQELQESTEEADRQLEVVRSELDVVSSELEKAKLGEQLASHRVGELEVEVRRADSVLRRTESALKVAEQNLIDDETQIAALRGEVLSLEKEKERLTERSRNDHSHNPFAAPTEADVQALEAELDDAHREIGRLTSLLDQSPSRKAVDTARDAKIEMLEKEKEDLLERNRALRRTFTDITTPNKTSNTSGISPIHRHVLSMSVRAPKTPGAPLPEMSWLNMTTVDQGIAPLLAEISRLQRELDVANDSIDDKIDKLEEAGLGVVGLTRKLEDARVKITRLEEELARLRRTEDRRLRQLGRLRCQKCRVKIEVGEETSSDISVSHLPLEPPTPPTRTSEALRKELQHVNSELARMKLNWDTERHQLLDEKAALQDATNRLSSQIKSEGDRGKAVAKVTTDLRSELDQAREMIAELEEALKGQRGQLRTITIENERVQREKELVLAQVHRNGSDMDEVTGQLSKLKRENKELEHELRVNVNAEQRARILEGRVAENLDAIDQLRQERSLLARDHRNLQKQFSALSEHAKDVQEQHALSQVSHDDRRHELDLQLMELEELRHALAAQGAELKRAESANQNMESLQMDLKRVRREAEAFGRDLEELKKEKQTMETEARKKRQLESELRVVREQLAVQTRKADEMSGHTCAADSSSLEAIKLQHKRECKGLIVQIKYLKAKFTRESCLRMDLAHQKKYMLVLLARFENSEQTIFAAIARVGGFSENMDESRSILRTKRTFRSVAKAIVFISRIQKLSEAWRTHSATRQGVVAALEEVRRKRVVQPK